MNKLDFASFMEEYLNEKEVSPRFTFDAKKERSDQKKLIKAGLRTPSGRLTPKGNYYHKQSASRTGDLDWRPPGSWHVDYP